MLDTIIQWNVNGFRARKQEISLLLAEKNPSCVCLQELKLSTNSPYDIGSHYKAYSKLPNGDDEFPRGGTLVAVRRDIPHTSLQLNTPLQAVAISLTTGDLRSICSVYLPPTEQVSELQIKQLIDQLPEPTMIVGDMNAHNPMWYGDRLDQRGELLQSAIEAKNLLVLNEDQPTFYRVSDQISSHIDLALITDTCPTEYSWNTLDDLHGSDPYPIQITATRSSPNEYTERWNFEKADWGSYRELATTTEKVDDQLDINQAWEHLKETILNASCRTIPKVKLNSAKRPCLPWWNHECKTERSKVRSAFKTMKNKPNRITIKIYKRRLAIKVRTFRQAKQTSWRQYISSLTAKTPTSKLWKRIRKVSGKYIPKPHPILKQGNNTITSKEEVAEIFAENYAATSTARNQHEILQDVT